MFSGDSSLNPALHSARERDRSFDYRMDPHGAFALVPASGDVETLESGLSDGGIQISKCASGKPRGACRGWLYSAVGNFCDIKPPVVASLLFWPESAPGP